MDQRKIFLLSDAALRQVIDGLTPDELTRTAPDDWSRRPNATVAEIVKGHTYDEAWVPDVLAGKTVDEVGDTYKPLLKRETADVIADYDRVHDLATAAVTADPDLEATAHLTYGDFPRSVFYEHTSFFRAFQAWSIGRFVGREVTLPAELVSALTELVMPQLEQLRGIHVFGPEVAVPDGADAQTRLLGMTGFWRD
jgi:hypothetical protein